MNDFEKLGERYDLSCLKPDKRYSILPTMLLLLQQIEGKKVLDVGCGSGFFTEEIGIWNPSKLYGIDNCKSKLQKARKKSKTKAEYILRDIFADDLPKVDRICAPFVINYAETRRRLVQLVSNFYDCLEVGRLVGAVDLPDNSKNQDLLRKRKFWGATKEVKGKLRDGEKIEITLYKNEVEICRLLSTYWSKRTIEEVLIGAGFRNIKWFKPILNRGGIERFGRGFWKGYEDNCELGYFLAEKR